MTGTGNRGQLMLKLIGTSGLIAGLAWMAHVLWKYRSGAYLPQLTTALVDSLPLVCIVVSIVMLSRVRPAARPDRRSLADNPRVLVISALFVLSIVIIGIGILCPRLIGVTFGLWLLSKVAIAYVPLFGNGSAELGIARDIKAIESNWRLWLLWQCP